MEPHETKIVSYTWNTTIEGILHNMVNHTYGIQLAGIPIVIWVDEQPTARVGDTVKITIEKVNPNALPS